MLRNGTLLLLILMALNGRAQLDSSAFRLLPGVFEVQRSERLDQLSPTGSSGPVLFSTQDEALLIRPIDMNTGMPKTTLTIRSNAVKKIEQYEHHGDSIFALVRTVDRPEPDWYETVIYTLTGDSLAQAMRHTIDLPLEPQKNAQPIHFKPSSNGKHLVVCRQAAFFKGKTGSVNIEVSSFPDNRSTAYNLPLPFDADDVKIDGASIDNNGIVYIAARAGIKLNSPFMRKHLIYTFNPTTKELHEFDLSADKIFIQDMNVVTRDSSLEIMAFYAADPFLQTESNGYLFVKIDSGGSKVVTRAVNAFRGDMVEAQRGGESVSGNTIDDLVLDHVYYCDDEPVIVMEKQFRDQICTTDPRTGIITCTDQFHHEGISIENLADRTKSITIGRRQIDYNNAGPYISHQSFMINGQLVLLYNDHYKNESPEAERIMNNPSRSVMRYYIYGCDGTIKTDLTTGERSDYLFVAKLPGYAQNNRITVLFSSGRDYRIGLLQTDRIP